MKSAVVTVVAFSQLQAAEDALHSYIQFNSNADGFVVLVDAEDDKGFDLSSFAFSALWGQEVCSEGYFDKAFAWEWEPLRAFVELNTMQKLFGKGYEKVVLLHPALRMKRPFDEQVTAGISVQVVKANASDLTEAPKLMCFTKLDEVEAFIAWCIKRFDILFRHAIDSGRKQWFESSFYYTWVNYCNMFGINYTSTISKSLEVEEIEAVYNPFLYFSNGVEVAPFLKLYYMRNYRLRLECKGNPFTHENLFFNKNIVLGEEEGLLLNAAAEAVWCARPDIQKAFPEYRASQRQVFAEWFVRHAAEEYTLPDAYIQPVKESIHAFLNTPPVKRKRIFRREPAPLIKELPWGVNLCAHIRGEYGIGEASRMLAQTLEAGSVPFTVVDIASENNYDYTNKKWVHKISNTFPYSVNLLYTNADGLQPFLQDVSPQALEGRVNIGYWSWELPEFPDEWVPAFEHLDEVWTISRFAAASIATKSPVPVFSLPHAVVLETPDPKYNKRYFGIPEEDFVFLCMYDTRSITQRKNPQGAVEAFLKAFEGAAGVRLVIKVNAPEGTQQEHAWLRSLHGRESITLLYQYFDRPALNGLLNSSDAFVSLHRSEGFGFGPAEAMFYAKPAILTNWSGSLEYTREGACCPVDYKLVEIKQDYGPYKKGWHWAEPDVEQAAVYMRRLVDDKEYCKTIGANGQQVVRNILSPAKLGEKAAKRLHEITTKR